MTGAPGAVDVFPTRGWRLDVNLHSAAAVAHGIASVPAAWDEEDELDLVAGAGPAIDDTNPGVIAKLGRITR